MTDRLVPTGDGHTELSDEDRHDLIPTYIATRRELFDAEQRNIATALLRRPPTIARLLDDKYLRDLHRAMFADVWSWAGHYRARETNIGIEPHLISTAVRALVDDANAWIDHHTYPPEEITVASTIASWRCIRSSAGTVDTVGSLPISSSSRWAARRSPGAQDWP